MLDPGNLRETYRLWKSSTKMIGKLIDIELNGIQLKYVKIIDLLDDGTIELLINGTIKRFTNSEISFSSSMD